MDKEFTAIGSKLDKISQKIDKLTLTLKALIVEFSQINKNIVDNLKTLSRQIIAYNEKLDDTAGADFDKYSKLLEEIHENINKFSKSPEYSIIEINQKMKDILSLVEQTINPQDLNIKLLKIKEFLEKFK
ncbi:MAG: hypothetical protein ACTSRP_15825 [Candidatus Helarchaeota archaeon]